MEKFNLDLTNLHGLYTDWNLIRKHLLPRARRYGDTDDIEALYYAVSSLLDYFSARGDAVNGDAGKLIELDITTGEKAENLKIITGAWTGINAKIGQLGLFKKLEQVHKVGKQYA